MHSTLPGVVEHSRTDLWFSCAIVLGCVGALLLAVLGVLAWEPALALLVAIACTGELIQEIVRRARNQAAGEDQGLSARFFGLLALGALTGLLLAIWFG